jgi:3',5'-cyclic AMP phosphodiesterase CpdA
MTGSRVAVVSDTHLSRRTPEALTNWDAVARWVDETRPDLVLHLGDLAMDGTTGDDLALARERLDGLAAPWRAVPGNHDVGDIPTTAGPDDGAIDEHRLGRWRDTVGADHWALDLDRWTLIGLDAQLIGSGLDAEEEQGTWLVGTLARLPADRPVALALHKPVTAPQRELAAGPTYRWPPPADRARLARLLDTRTVPLVLSGHVHQWRELDAGGRHHVWAPTAWAVLPDTVQPLVGHKRCGVVALDLAPHGRASVELVEPEGLRQLTLLEDIPNPYGH